MSRKTNELSVGYNNLFPPLKFAISFKVPEFVIDNDSKGLSLTLSASLSVFLEKTSKFVGNN